MNHDRLQRSDIVHHFSASISIQPSLFTVKHDTSDNDKGKHTGKADMLQLCVYMIFISLQGFYVTLKN